MLERILEILAAALEAKAKANDTKPEDTSLDFAEKLAAVKDAVAAEAPTMEFDPEKGEGPLADARTAAQARYDEIKEGPRNGAALEELRLTGAWKDGLTAQLNTLAEWDDAEGSESISEKEETPEAKAEREAKEAEEAKAAEEAAKAAELEELRKNDPEAAKAAEEAAAAEAKAAEEAAEVKAAEEAASQDIEEPVDGPRELVSASARGRRRRRVSASALGSNRSNRVRSRRSARKELAPITAGATTEHGGTGAHMDFDGNFMAEMEEAIAAGAVGNDLKIVASVNPYGRPTADNGALVDVSNGGAIRNHEQLFGGREDLAVTAAVCGPAEPIREIQSCFTADTPVLDSLTMRQAMYGQIQVYAPASLPEDATGIMLPAPDCEKCPGEADIDCLTVECEDPLPAVKATPIQACLCVSESLAFSAPFVLESYMQLLSARYAQVLEIQRLQAIRAQSFNRTFTPPYGAAQGIVQAAAQVMHLISSNSRYNGPAEDYQIVIPRGTSYTMLADIMNRLMGCCYALDDYLEALDDLGISTIIQTLDSDGQHCTQGALNVPQTFVGDLGPAGCAPLEPFHQTPSMYIYRKDAFLTASPFDIQVGIDSRDKSEIEQGCVRMIRREYWVPPVKFGCSPSIVLDFEEMCAAGTGPDAMEPVADCDMEGGGGTPSDAPGD